MVTIKSLKLWNDLVPLLPAPNVNEEATIQNELRSFQKTDMGLLEGPLKIVSAHRNTLLYLENGAVLYRANPTTPTYNGYASLPDGQEECFVQFNDLWFKAMVDFT